MPFASISLVTSRNLPISAAMDEKMMSLLNAAVAPKVSMDGAMQSYVYLSHYDIMTHSHFDT
jgi:hypothetical protein